VSGRSRAISPDRFRQIMKLSGVLNNLVKSSVSKEEDSSKARFDSIGQHLLRNQYSGSGRGNNQTFERNWHPRVPPCRRPK
jgi:hypothetical protein